MDNKMSPDLLEKLKYPIGRFERVEKLDKETLDTYTIKLRDFPKILGKAIQSYSEDDFKRTYRPGGWNIAKVIHHLVDSHIHCYVRFKYALLENTPSIKDYTKPEWAELPDATQTDVKSSIAILKGILQRWTTLTGQMKAEDFEKSYYHPGKRKYYPLYTVVALYAWNSYHHLAHINNIE